MFSVSCVSVGVGAETPGQAAAVPIATSEPTVLLPRLRVVAFPQRRVFVYSHVTAADQRVAIVILALEKVDTL